MYRPINMAEFVGGSIIKDNDTKNNITIRLMDGYGMPKDLTGSTITWSLATERARLMDNRAATITGTGLVEISLLETDAFGHGALYVQVNVTKNGETEIFPADGQLIIRITPSHDNLTYMPVTFASLETVEQRLEALFNTFEGEVVQGAAGDDGVGLTFLWNGTQLGVKREDQPSYTYMNLKGPKGDQGDEGPAGPAGTGISLKGSVATVEELPQTGNTISDAYLVGTFVHIWTGSAWNNAGEIKGPKGDQGPPGEGADVYFLDLNDYAADVVGGKWTNAITNAVADLAPGGTLVVPDGEYLTDAFIVNKACLITGSGTFIYDFDIATGPMMSVTATDVTIENLSFKAVGAFGTYDYRAYIHTNVMHTIVENCRFYEGSQGVHFANGATRGKVSNCVADRCFNSGFLILGAENNTIAGCTAISCGDGAISLFNARYCVVSSCIAEYCDQGITIDAGAIGNTISNNQIYGEKDGLTFRTGYYGIDLKNNSHSNTVNGNTIYGCVVGIAARYGDANDGGTLQNTSSNNVITGNTITECSNKGWAPVTGGILIQAQYGLIISSNVFSRIRGPQIFGNADGSFNANVLITDNLMNMHGNNFGAFTYLAIDKEAIKLSGFKSLKIANNVFQCAPELRTLPIVSLTDCEFDINGNTFERVTYRGVLVAGTASGQIHNNSFASGNNTSNTIELTTTGFVDIKNNTQFGNGSRRFIKGNATPFAAEGNRFNCQNADAIDGTGAIRLFNNVNQGVGMDGGELRHVAGVVEIKSGGVWTPIGGGGSEPAEPTPAYYVSMADYAHLIDGTTGKWTFAITTALSDVPIGGTLMFPEGDYLTDSFPVTKKCTLTGPGKLIYDFDAAVDGMIRANANDIKIEQLSFAAVGVVGTTGYKPYIQTTFANVVVDGCFFEGGRQAVAFNSGSTNGKVTNSVARNCLGSGFLVRSGAQANISNNTAVGCGYGGVALVTARYCVVANNTVKNSEHGIVVDEGSTGNTISGNTISGDDAGTTAASGNYGIDLKNNSSNNTISGNSIHGFITGIAARYGDVGKQATSYNNAIAGNALSGIKGKTVSTTPSGILFEGQYGLLITNNIFSRIEGAQMRGVAAGSFNSNVHIADNLVNMHGRNFGTLPYLPIDQQAILADGYTGISFANNVFQCAPEVRTKPVIEISNTDFKAEGNLFKDLTHVAVLVKGTATAEIRNNDVRTFNDTATFVKSTGTGHVGIHNNRQTNLGLRYFVDGGTAPLTITHNKFITVFADAITGTGEIRVLNNENPSTGTQGGEMRFNNDKLEIKVAGVWGLAGVAGPPGSDGIDGNDGAPGSDGIDGNDGAPGKNLEYNWSGYTLGVRQEGAGTYTYSQSLRGQQGAPGNDGAPGTDGKDLEYLWNGYTLGVRKVGDATYTYSQSLRGEQGIQGNPGAPGNDGADASLFIEQRTTDPTSPVNGQVWIRTDL